MRILASLVIASVVVGSCGGTKGADPAEFGYDPTEPLKFAEGDIVESPLAPNTEIHVVTFNGQNGKEVTGLMANPHEGPTDTAVLLLHGISQGSGVASADMIEPIRDWSCAGAITLAIDMPYARPDLLRFNEPFTLDETDRDETIQLTVDLQRSVDLLIEQGAEKVAFVAVSGGAVAGALYAGIETRVDGYALILANGGPVARWKQFGIKSVMMFNMTDDEADEYADLMYPYAGIHFIGNTNAPILFVNGRLDPIIGEDAANALHEASGDNAEVVWYEAGHDLPLEAFIEVHYWVGELLGLDRGRLEECEPIAS